ncbi:MAG: hypothetical protein ACXWCR_01195 [Flavitalea sp.]
MKHISICLLAVLISFAGFSQAAFETKSKFFNKEKRTVQIEVPYEPEIVEKAIGDSMARLGIRGSKVKGYSLFRSVSIDGEIADLYFNIDRKSRKDKSSIVSVFAVAPNSNPADVDSDEMKIYAARNFLSGIMPAIDQTNQLNNIAAQEKEITGDEKKLKNLVNDQEDYQKKIKNLQERAEKNLREQEELKRTLDSKRSILNAMRAKMI